MEPIPGSPVTAFGWPVIPGGLTELLTMLKDRYGERLPPVYVTENGCSVNDEVAADGTVDDQPRIGHLDGHIRAVHAAMIAGVGGRGYFVWSLMDNFEWSEGYPQRLAFVHVAFEPQPRPPRASFARYRHPTAPPTPSPRNSPPSFHLP